MSFILGNQAVLSAFEKVAKSGQYSHAYIIEGAEGSGRTTLARAIAATVTCREERACFTCPNCKKIMEGIHQDVIEISREEDSASIKIDQIRDAIKEAYIKPAECDKKIFIIRNSQLMGPAAQNALLQTFEEPPKNVMFFLTVTNRNLLLPTLKSRAVTLKTEKFSDSAIKDKLLELYPDGAEYADEASLLADGSLGKAKEFMESEDSRSSIALVKEYFSAVNGNATYAQLGLILHRAVSKDKSCLFSTMSYFSLALRDVIVFSSGYSEKAMFFTDRALLSSLAEKLDKKKLFEAYDTVSVILRDNAKINTYAAQSAINSALAYNFS